MDMSQQISTQREEKQTKKKKINQKIIVTKKERKREIEQTCNLIFVPYFQNQNNRLNK